MKKNLFEYFSLVSKEIQEAKKRISSFEEKTEAKIIEPEKEANTIEENQEATSTKSKKMKTKEVTEDVKTVKKDKDREKSKVTEDVVKTKCFCGVTVEKKYIVSHVVKVHNSLLPNKSTADENFESGSSKCRHCGFHPSNIILLKLSVQDVTTADIRRYHMFTEHKDKIAKVPQTPQDGKKEKDDKSKSAV